MVIGMCCKKTSIKKTMFLVYEFKGRIKNCESKNINNNIALKLKMQQLVHMQNVDTFFKHLNKWMLACINKNNGISTI
jgi:hypothetical protein